MSIFREILAVIVNLDIMETTVKQVAILRLLYLSFKAKNVFKGVKAT